jgi:hypothetical protein
MTGCRSDSFGCKLSGNNIDIRSGKELTEGPMQGSFCHVASGLLAAL